MAQGKFLCYGNGDYLNRRGTHSKGGRNSEVADSVTVVRKTSCLAISMGQAKIGREHEKEIKLMNHLQFELRRCQVPPSRYKVPLPEAPLFLRASRYGSRLDPCTPTRDPCSDVGSTSMLFVVEESIKSITSTSTRPFSQL